MNAEERRTWDHLMSEAGGLLTALYERNAAALAERAQTVQTLAEHIAAIQKRETR